jgi:DNA-binding transcriptional MerR regulator
MRIGEVAEAAGTTVRTIRYYEEIGLLAASGERAAGAHRVYGEDDVVRIREILRLRDVLGLSLDELREVLEDEDTRTALREEYWSTANDARRRAILDEAERILERRTALLDRRRAELDELQADLDERRTRIARRRTELSATPARR